MATVLVSPRSEGTNTPLKIYEYLASGIPIVATDIQSHTQILDDDVSFLVKPDGPSMARGIIASLEDMERRNRTIANARRLFEEKYSRTVYESKIRRLDGIDRVMCGIAGIACFGDIAGPRYEQLKGMCDTLIHRGPDDEGIDIRDGVGMGMRRLSIIDLSGGKQPISNEDDTSGSCSTGKSTISGNCGRT